MGYYESIIDYYDFQLNNSLYPNLRITTYPRLIAKKVVSILNVFLFNLVRCHSFRSVMLIFLRSAT